MLMQTWKNTEDLPSKHSPTIPSSHPVSLLKQSIALEAGIQSSRLSEENWEQSPVPTSFNM